MWVFLGGSLSKVRLKCYFALTNANALKCYNLRFIFLSDIAYYQDINFTLNYCNYRIIYNKKNPLLQFLFAKEDLWGLSNSIL